jgi:hypothetical protein
MEETNPLAIVPDSHPVATPARPPLDLEVVPAGPPVEAGQVKKAEVETKVTAWQTAEMAKINNRFKREELVINGWETDQVEKASAWLKKIEVIGSTRHIISSPLFLSSWYDPHDCLQRAIFITTS